MPFFYDSVFMIPFFTILSSRFRFHDSVFFSVSGFFSSEALCFKAFMLPGFQVFLCLRLRGILPADGKGLTHSGSSRSGPQEASS